MDAQSRTANTNQGGQLLDRWKTAAPGDHAFESDLFELIRQPLARGARVGLNGIVGKYFAGQDVDDVASEAAVIVFDTDPHTIKDGVEEFAFGVARNKGRDLGRKLRRMRDQSRVELPESPDPATLVVERQMSLATMELLKRCWGELEPKQREVIEYVELRNGKFKDWAAANGAKPQAAQQRYKRGTKKLRKCLQRLGLSDDH